MTYTNVIYIYMHIKYGGYADTFNLFYSGLHVHH